MCVCVGGAKQLTLVVFLGLYVASHLTLLHFRHGDAEEQDRSHIPLVLCAAGLAVALGTMLLVPFTILGHEAMASYGDSWYVKWISYSLILGLWNKVFWGANLSLFFMLPVAYFYYEAEGLGGKGPLARFYEATVVFGLVSSILAGLIYILYNSFALPTSQYLIFSYSLISMTGSLLVLGIAPLGILRLASYTTKLALDGRRELLQNGFLSTIHPSAVPFERTVLQVRLNEHHGDPQQIISLLNRLSAFEQSRSNNASTLWRMILRRVAYVVALSAGVTTYFFAGYIAIRVAVHLFVGLFLTVLVPALSDHLQTIVTFLLPVSSLGTLLDCIAALYLIPSIMLGFYSLPGLHRLRPVVGQTSMAGVVVNTAAMVLMASSFPVVVDLLGLSRLDLMGAFGCASYARDTWFAVGYCIAFLIASTFSFRSFLSTVGTSEPSQRQAWRAKTL